MKATLRSEPFSGNEIPGVPNCKITLATDIDFWKGFLFNIKGTGVGPQRFISDFANKVEKMGGYYTLDIRLSYAWKGLKAFVGVNNITNQKYAEFGVVNTAGDQFFYSSPERNFVGGVSYTF